MARLTILIASVAVVAADTVRFLAVGGNGSFSVQDQGKRTVTWLSHAKATARGGDLSIDTPSLYIEDFRLLEWQSGSGLTAFDATFQRLYLLGEEATAWNSSVAGSMRLAVVDTSTEPPQLHRLQTKIPIANIWHDQPIDDVGSHASFLVTWGTKLVLAGPSAPHKGNNNNFTVFVLDAESLEVERTFCVDMGDREVTQGPAQLDDATSTLHFLVDQLYFGQRIYHLDLSSGALKVSDVPGPQVYWANLVNVPSAKALFGPAKVNVEGRAAQQEHGRHSIRAGAADSSWYWAKLDLSTGAFSNKSLGGLGCIPITNPEDNIQTIAGVVPGIAASNPSHVYLGLTCQPDPSDIKRYVGFIDYESARMDGLWAFDGVERHWSSFWYLGQAAQAYQEQSVLV